MMTLETTQLKCYYSFRLSLQEEATSGVATAAAAGKNSTRRAGTDEETATLAELVHKKTQKTPINAILDAKQ